MSTLDPIDLPLDGATLIEASAGTGKTHTMTTLFVRLIVERGLGVSDILVVTFTRAATDELRNRLRRRLLAARAAIEGDASDPDLARLFARRAARAARDREALVTAIRDFDQASVFTIHGFCQRVLTDHALESGVPFDIEFIEDATALIDDVVRDFWTAELAHAPEIFVRHVRKACDIAALSRLARQVIADPDLQVLPPHDEGDGSDELPALAERRRELAREVGALWRQHRDEILALLGESRFNKVSYRPDRVAGRWAPYLDRVEHTAPGLEPWFAKLAPEHMALRKGETPPEHPFFEACARLLSCDVALCETLDRLTVAWQRRFVAYAREAMARRKAEQGVQSFDDLLHRLRDALAGPGGGVLAHHVRRSFRAALVDEFQDTDRMQYDIFRRIYAETGQPLLLIGDPKQAIYAFRGADVFAYLDAVADVGERRATLATNWRSDPPMVRAINTLFERARRPFALDHIDFVPTQPRLGATQRLGGALSDEPALRVIFVERDPERAPRGTLTVEWAQRALPERIACEVARLLSRRGTIDGRPVEPADIAILCRTNQQARDVQQVLRERRIPSVLTGDDSVFDSVMAEELDSVLQAVARPDDSARLRAAITSSMLGVNGDELYRLQQDERAWDGWVEAVRRWHELWHERGFMQAFADLMDERGVYGRLLSRPDGERRLTDVLHLAELLHAAARLQHWGPLSLLHWFEQMRLDRAARDAAVVDDTQVRLESDARAVRLTTVHRSKGLEYPIVLCPYAWHTSKLSAHEQRFVRFHDPGDGQRCKVDLGSEHKERHRQLAEHEALAESLRLLYVALTRARHHCIVVWGSIGDADRAPLGYLLHQPDGESEDPATRPRGGTAPSSAVPPHTPPSVVELRERVAERVKSLGDAEMLADLTRLCRASQGAIGVSALSREPAPAYDPPVAATASFEARPFGRVLDRRHRSSSFSALLSQREVSGPQQEGHDRDEQVEPGLPDEMASDERVTLHDFPPGPSSGLLIHHIYEHIDFQRGDAGELPAQIQRSLARYGVEPAWAPRLERAIDDTLRAPLGAGFRLCDISRANRLDELEFTLPVAEASDFAPRPLASLFRRFLSSPDAGDYAARVESLGFVPLTGFLRGFIDVVVRHDGRFYVIDYKSNHLGPHAGAYAPARLARVMAEHHYYLQYHLYALALHRYLTRRLPGYDYEQHFGGVLYLFARGVAEHHPAGSGVFVDRPPGALLEALSQLLGGAP